MSEETVTPPVSGDTPEQPAVPEVKAEVKPETQPEPKPDAPDPATAEPPKKKVDPRQKKIAELSYQNRELSRRLDKVLGMFESQLNTPRTEDAPPKVDDFKTLEEYLDARLAYQDKKREVAVKPAENPQEEQYHQTLAAAKEDLTASGSEKYEDFEEVVYADEVKISPYMRDAIFALDDVEIQADVAYYLGKNPKEALRISRLPPIRQVAEIGKIEVKLTTKPVPQKKPPAAPAPIEPVGGSHTPSDEIQPVEDFQSFLRKRNKQLGKR